MIQPNELRIGNWYNEFGIPKIATPQLILRLYQIEIAGKTAIDVSPIPLTPEVLEKCGFEKEQNKIDIYTRGRLRLWIGAMGSCLCYLVEEDTTTGHYIPKQVSYLHQLQNLYFALTGEELNYTP